MPDLSENNTYCDTAPQIQVRAFDLHFHTVWYKVGGTKIMLTNGVSEFFDSVLWESLPQGLFLINIFANDSAGNINDTYIINLYKDTLAPKITINSPENHTYWNTQPLINISAFDPNLFEISYEVEIGTTLSVTLNSSEEVQLHIDIWSLLPEGEFVIKFLAKDTFGHINDTLTVTLYKDTIAPIITINFPNEYDIFGRIPPDVDVNFNVPNLDSTWYQLYNGSITTANYMWNGIISQNVWDEVGNGTVTIRIYANDTLGNPGFDEVTVRKNIYAPIITILYPNNNELFGISAPNFVILKEGLLINITWYSLDDGVTYYTFTGSIGTINQAAWDAFGNELITIKFYINDSWGDIGNIDEVIVRKDIIAPKIAIYLPINETYWNTVPIINISAIDPSLVDKIWYTIGTTNIELTNNIEQALETSIWNTLDQGEFQIYIYANDSVGNINNTYVLLLYKDTIAPDIIINSPNKDQEIGKDSPFFDISIIENNSIDACWYSIDGGITNITFTGMFGRINQTLWEEIWDDLSEGETIIIIFYAKDMSGNVGFRDVEVIKFISEPFNFIENLSGPMGLILNIAAIGIVIPVTIATTKSRFYNSLDKKDKTIMRKFLFLTYFLLFLIFIVLFLKQIYL